MFNSDVYDQWFNPNVQGNPGGITADQLAWDGMPASAAITLPANSLLVFARDQGELLSGHDNATGPASLEDYLPRLGTGHVLITSRCQELGDGAGALELDGLPETEAVGLRLGGEPAGPAQRAVAAAWRRRRETPPHLRRSRCRAAPRG